MRCSDDPPSQESVAEPGARGWLRVVGIVLLLFGFLGLASTPQLLYQATHRGHYTRTEATALSPTSRTRSVRIRIASTGEEVSVRRTTFDGSPSGSVHAVWFDPDAIVYAGAQLFDERVVTIARHPELPTVSEGVIGVAVTLCLCGLGGFLLLRPVRDAVAKRPNR